MSVEVIAVVLLAALMHAGWNALVHGASDKLQDTVLILCGAALITLFCLPWLPLPDPRSWSFLLASVVIHIGYFSIVALSYRGAELSVVYPVMRGSAPAISAVGMLVLLGESPSRNGWAGVALISAGIIALAGSARANHGLHMKPVLLALCNAVIIATYTIVDATGARLAGNAFAYTGWLYIGVAMSMLVLVCLLRGSVMSTLTGMGKRWTRGLVGGACTLASYALALWAMTRAPVAMVAALREVSVVFALLIGAHFAKESISPVRMLSAALVVAGAMLMKFA